MEESIPLMKKANKEEGAAWARVSRDCGFTGISKLVTLYKLMDLMSCVTLLLI